MEEMLSTLYLLQRVDTNLDDVEGTKGGLPEMVRSLEADIAELTAKINKKQEYIDNQVASRNKADEDIATFTEKLKKYKEQQYQVRNNKEYDAISKEIEFSEESIKNLTNLFEDFENMMSSAKSEIEELKTQLGDQQSFLDEKKSDLSEISKETEEEEKKYNKERKKLIAKISEDLLSRYDKIRSARGKAVVAVRKESCSGCGNRIPPQHIIELRRNDHMYICQHCGRIVVSDELAKKIIEAEK